MRNEGGNVPRGCEIAGRPTLAYAGPQARVASRIAVPISRRFAVALWLIAIAPTLAGVTSPSLLYATPLIPIMLTAISGGVAVAAFVLRCTIVPLPSEFEARGNRAAKRLASVVAGTIAWLIFVSTGGAIRVAFLLHYPLFESARVRAIATLPPGGAATHGWVGLFPVSRINRGLDGEVGFVVSVGDSIHHDPTPATYFLAEYPPGNGGPLGGGWRWEATD